VKKTIYVRRDVTTQTRVRRDEWAHKNQVLTCTASISFDFGDIKTFAVQML
jgi:hypothetical protein